MHELRPLEPSELPAAYDALELAFGGTPVPEERAIETSVIDAPRTLGAFDGQTPVATAGWFDHRMTLPGAVAPVAGVTWVSVSPAHRRQGLLTALMRRQLDDLRAQARPIAALWASEAAIYQRFGYGPASWRYGIDVRRGAGFTRPVQVAGLRLDEPGSAPLASVYDAVAPTVPGYVARDARWWAFRLHDPEHRRQGASPLRCVLDGADGYALYATKSIWSTAGSAGVVSVRELVARTPAAEARLWRYLLDIDLMGSVTADVPLDSAVLHLLAEPRAAVGRLGDALWVRLVSVGEALETRRYAAEVDVVLDVTDAFCPWNAGRWRLSAGPSGAVCAPTTDPADLALDARDLGAAFLGGTSLTARYQAGWVTELTKGALAAATVAFGWPGPAPYCPMIF